MQILSLLPSIAAVTLLAFGLATGGVLFLWKESGVPALGVGSALYLSGVALLIAAKWRSWQHGVCSNFGPGSLSRAERRLYFAGYSLMAFATAASLLAYLHASR